MAVGWLIEISKQLSSPLGSCCSRGQSGSCPWGPSRCSQSSSLQHPHWVLSCFYAASYISQKKDLTMFSLLLLKITQRALPFKIHRNPPLSPNRRTHRQSDDSHLFIKIYWPMFDNYRDICYSHSFYSVSSTSHKHWSLQNTA